MTRGQLLEQIAEYLCRIRLTHPLRVGMDGVDAAGKTTLADALMPVLERRGRTVLHASIDGFHNRRNTRYARGSLSPEGYYYDSFNYAALKEFLLVPLGPDGNREYRVAAFDFLTDRPVSAPQCTAPADAILLFDGVFLFRPEIADFWDVKMFVDICFEESIARAVRRDQSLMGSVEAVRERYSQRYIPWQRLYLERRQPMELADVVIDNNNVDAPVLLRCAACGDVADCG